MIPDNNFNDQDDFLNTDDNERFQDMNNEDAAKLNADEFERTAVARDRDKTRNTGSDTEQARFNKQQQDEAINSNKQNAAANRTTAERPLTTQGTEKEIEENMGGTTNLTLDQLKKEGDPEGTRNR